MDRNTREAKLASHQPNRSIDTVQEQSRWGRSKNTRSQQTCLSENYRFNAWFVKYCMESNQILDWPQWQWWDCRRWQRHIWCGYLMMQTCAPFTPNVSLYNPKTFNWRWEFGERRCERCLSTTKFMVLFRTTKSSQRNYSRKAIEFSTKGSIRHPDSSLS